MNENRAIARRRRDGSPRHRLRALALAGAGTLLSAAPAADGRSDTLVAYSENGANLARSRTWNGADWRSEPSTADIQKTPMWVVTANCPTRPETALAAIDSDKDINLAFHDGDAWTSRTELNIDVEVNTERCFNLAYEQQTGDLLVAHWSKADGKLAYRTWDGTALSGQNTLTLPSNKKLRWVELVPKRDSNSIMLVCSNDDKDIVACLWTGNAWGTVTTLETNCNYTTEQPFSFAWEQQSGTGVVAYGDGGNEPRYRTWNGGWSGELTAPTVNKKQRFIKIAADPASDEIVMGTLDDGKDLNVLVWNGSSWGAALEIEADMTDRDARYFDVAYEAGEGGEAVVVYSQNGEDAIRYRTWNGTAWSAEQTGPDLGDQPIVIQLRTGAEPGEVFIAVADNGSDVNLMRWDGDSMSANTVIETSHGADSTDEPFMIAVAPVANVLTVVTDPSSPTAQETLRKRQFEYWGYQVNLIDESASQASFDAAVADNHVAYIPEDVVSSNLGTKLVAATIGVVVEESDCFDVFGLTADNAMGTVDTAITVLAYDHYITQPFAAGDLTICDSAQDMNETTQVISSGGQVLADWPGGGGRALVTLEAHARLVDATRAPGRRVFLPMADNNFDWAELNADGKTIAKRSLEWGRGIVARWKLDETAGTTAADELDDYDAILVNMDPATDWTEGRSGGGLDFDGINDRATSPAIMRPPVEGTVAFWMRVPGSPASHGRVLGLADEWEIRHVTTGTADGIPYGLVFDLGWDGVNTVFVTTVTVDQPNRWYHVVATYSQLAGTYAVYLDGELHKSGAATLAVPDPYLISLGTRTASSNYFVGVLDDVRILNHVMELDEVKALRDTGMPRLVTWQETEPD